MNDEGSACRQSRLLVSEVRDSRPELVIAAANLSTPLAIFVFAVFILCDEIPALKSIHLLTLNVISLLERLLGAELKTACYDTLLLLGVKHSLAVFGVGSLEDRLSAEQVGLALNGVVAVEVVHSLSIQVA